MANTARTELCSIWEEFAKNPSNQHAAKKAQQWRPQLLNHLEDCEICAAIKFTHSRHTTQLTKYLGLQRTLTAEEWGRLENMRLMAEQDEKHAVEFAQQLVAKLLPDFVNPFELYTPYATPLALFQCIRAIEVIVRRIIRQFGTASGESPESIRVKITRDGTIHLPDGDIITQQTLIVELALAGEVPHETAAKLLGWITGVGASHGPDIFRGFGYKQEGNSFLLWLLPDGEN
jgi:hypothetical protein